MSNPPHTRNSGLQLFFTVRLANRHDDLLVREIECLRRATRITRKRYPFVINEIVVLPAAIHTIWTLPKEDPDFGVRWRMLKSHFSRDLLATTNHIPMPAPRCEKAIWHRKFWEHPLRDADDYEAHRQMIFTAPVQAKLAHRPQDWTYSSIHRAIRQGEYTSPATRPKTFIPQKSKPIEMATQG